MSAKRIPLNLTLVETTLLQDSLKRYLRSWEELKENDPTNQVDPAIIEKVRKMVERTGYIKQRHITYRKQRTNPNTVKPYSQNNSIPGQFDDSNLIGW